jgi:hypothetical protein
MNNEFTAFIPMKDKTEQFTQAVSRQEIERFSADELRAWWAVADVVRCSTETERQARLKAVEERPLVFELYCWWVQFIHRRLYGVQIRSQEFHESRAGLIPKESLRELQDAAGLTLDQFRDSTLVEVFDLIESRKKKPTPDWKNRRDTLNETVEDQMLVLFKKDPRTAAMTATEIAAILSCSAPAVRKPDNKVWQMFKAEKESNQKRLKRRHTTDSTSDPDDE